MKRCKCGSFALNIKPESGFCDVCFYKQLIPVAEQFVAEHSEMKKFLAGFGPDKGCDCDGCRIARAVIGTPDEKKIKQK